MHSTTQGGGGSSCIRNLYYKNVGRRESRMQSELADCLKGVQSVWLSIDPFYLSAGALDLLIINHDAIHRSLKLSEVIDVQLVKLDEKYVNLGSQIVSQCVSDLASE